MEIDWTEKHDQCLACETVHRAQVRQQFADTLCGYDIATFTVSKRAVRDRYGIISSKHRKKLSAEERASGIEVEQTEFQLLLEELIEQEDLAKKRETKLKEKLNRISLKPRK